jgi:hypothetical protein
MGHSRQPEPFGTEGWYAHLERELRAALADVPPGTRFCLAERYVVDGGPDLGWHVRCSDGRVTFATEPADDADATLVVDIHIAREGLRPDSPEGRALQKAALLDGRIRWLGEPSRLPDALSGVHERIAALTRFDD